jgi:hypothetical protein
LKVEGVSRPTCNLQLSTFNADSRFNLDIPFPLLRANAVSAAAHPAEKPDLI